MTATQNPSVPLPEGVEIDGELDAQGFGTVAWVTDVGHVRGRNEDRLLVKTVWGGSWLLLLVADGAGGHDSGDKAAEQVVATFNACFPTEGEAPPHDPEAWLLDAITTGHANVRGLAEGQARPPASTVVGVLLERASLCGWRFHVGDSRLYVRPESGMVAQWTRDHNITNGLIDRGLPVAQALRIADGGRLTQVMGGASDPEAEILGPLKFDAGTVLLLCSDGIYGHNGDREVLLPAMKPDGGTVVERALALKQAVLDGDAPDNLTAVLWEVPEDLEPTIDRQTVTNSMRSVTAEDVEKALARKVRQELGLGPGPDDVEDELKPPSASAGSPVPTVVFAVLAIIAIAWFFRGRKTEAPPPPPPEPTVEEEAELPDAASSEPMEADQPPSDAVKAALDGLDQAWWTAQSPEDRDVLLGLLKDLLSVQSAEPVALLSPTEDGVAYSMDGWPQPGGANEERAGAAWAARSVILSQHPALAEQPSMAAHLRAAACSRVEIGWPRGDSVDPGEALQLGSWLGACLANPGDSVRTRLGNWPSHGWTLEDLNAAKFLASRDDPAQLLSYGDAESPRILELSLLAAALKQPVAQGLEVELTVVMPAGDFPDGNLPEERVVQATSRAHEVVGMLRSAVGDNAALRGSGRVANDLTEVFGVTAPTPEQRATLDSLNRRIDVRVTRPGLELDPDEDELPDEDPADRAAEDEFPDEELPDEPEAPAATTP